jgi:hypothetical protein
MSSKRYPSPASNSLPVALAELLVAWWDGLPGRMFDWLRWVLVFVMGIAALGYLIAVGVMQDEH